MYGPDEDDRQLAELTERQQWDQWLSTDKAYLEWLEKIHEGETDE